MRFSLRTMALAVGGLGAFFGVMTKLLIEKPEVFFQVLTILSTIVPFLLAIGTILWLGCWYKPNPVNPICAKCFHVLRDVVPSATPVCPHCGAELFQPRAVEFARNQKGRRWALAAWGVALLLMPLLISATRLIAWPSGDPLRVLSTERLIKERLPSRVNEPWVWDELERRMNSGALSSQEASDAVRELISYMTSASPNGWKQPLPWQGKFLRRATQGKLISDELQFELCDAYYGTEPKLTPLKMIGGGTNNDFQIEIEHGTIWDGNQYGLGVALLWNVKEVLLDGNRLQMTQLQKNDFKWWAHYQGKLEPGEHKITVEIECAYVDPITMKGRDMNKLPINNWPPARKRWTKTLSGKLKVPPDPRK